MNVFQFKSDLLKPISCIRIKLIIVIIIKLSYHPAKVAGDRHSGSTDITFLVCHMTSQDHVIKGSSDFMGGSPS